ncbi:hypothetical protein FXO38_11599 [Capsicum annuum]|nr:hypothetical protein FXO38_11599 [Capsicum annuum]
MGGVIIKKKVRGIPEHGYSCLLAFSYMIDTLNIGSTYSIMVNRDNCKFMYYFLALGACITGFAHMRKVMVIHATHLHEFSNHFVEFKNYYHETTFFLEHELGFEKWSIAYFPNNKYDMMTANIVEWINAMLIAERKYLVASIFNSIAKRFGEKFRERRAYVLNYKDKKFVHAAEKIAKDSMSEGDFFYVENINRDDNQFTVFGRGPMARFNLLKKSCSSRKYDLFKIPCAHAMAAL